jgi:predicted transcriptional regulator
MKELTKAEEQVMQILWKMEKAFVKDMIPFFDDPKPAYNTVSTIIRILEKKGFVSYISYGKTYEYFPIISKEEYTATSLNRLMDGYFENSYQRLVTFFAKKENISVEDLEKMKNMIDAELQSKKNTQNEQ